MTERTSHLAGLWTGAAISNTSNSNKACSATIKPAQITGKDEGRRHFCHKSIKNFSMELLLMYLYFPDTPLYWSHWGVIVGKRQYLKN